MEQASCRKVMAKNIAVEAAEKRYRQACRAKMEGACAESEEVERLCREEAEAFASLQAARLLPDSFVCDYARCRKEFEMSELVLIPFLRVIKQGEFLLDDGREKYIRLCVTCFNRLKIVAEV